MKHRLTFSLFLIIFAGMLYAQELITDYPGKVSEWNGGVRHDFQLNGIACILVEPADPAQGRPWYWKARFFDEFAWPEIELLKQGWTIAYTDVADLFGAPEAIRRFDQFYRFMTSHGYHSAPALAGYSRGGLIAINFASRYPERVSSLYLDNAACDFRTWPGSGKYPQGWQMLLNAYGLTEAEAENSLWNPVTRLEILARSQIPVLALCALKDTVVSPEKNTKRLEEIFNDCGGKLTTHYKPEANHHPHSLENPAPIVDFVKQNFASFMSSSTLQDVPMLWNPDFRCQYDSLQKQLVVTLWQWPQGQQVILKGISGEPTAIWMGCNGEKFSLPFVVRPDGWYVFLPAVQPAEGDQKLFVQLKHDMEMLQPVLNFNSQEPLVLDAANGFLKDGTWVWNVYFPSEQNCVVQLPHPVSVPLKVSNENGQADIRPGQRIALLNVSENGRQTISLEGLPEHEFPRVELADLRSAVIELALHEAMTSEERPFRLQKDNIVLNQEQQAVKWKLPFALNADFTVVAHYASIGDRRVEGTIASETSTLDFRATGSESRFLFLPVGQLRMTASQERPELCLNVQDTETLILRKVLLVPSGVDGIGEKLVTGEYVDVSKKDVFTLPLDQARLIGSNLRIIKGNNCITHWWLPNEYVIWPITNVKPGRYSVKANIGTIEPSRLALNAGGRTLLADIPNLNDYNAFKPFVFGKVEILRTQDVWLQVYPENGYKAVNLSELTLERVGN